MKRVVTKISSVEISMSEVVAANDPFFRTRAACCMPKIHFLVMIVSIHTPHEEGDHSGSEFNTIASISFEFGS